MDRFERAMAAIDAANAGDPHGREPLYARRMSQWLARLEPEADEVLRLAARAQHVRRWEIPRETYPMDRAGYHAWRTRLYDHHADIAAAILRHAGYDDAAIARVRALLRKERIKTDPQTQTLEDAICLVFLESEFATFRARKDFDQAKWINILRRTWAKMSPRGRELALGLPLDDESRQLLARALAP
jgi:hypothetical protein